MLQELLKLAGKPGLTGVANIRVDTVEKMQGRESRFIIVCYGFSNSRIESEIEFVYNFQRINVSLSRAKEKCIFIGSSSLLSASKLLDPLSSAAKGLELIRSLYNYVGSNHSGAFVSVEADSSFGTFISAPPVCAVAL